MEHHSTSSPLQSGPPARPLSAGSLNDYAIFILDPLGNIKSWNATAQRIKGYSGEEIIGQHFSVFYTPEDLASGKPERELEIARTVGHYQEEGVRVRKDETMFRAGITITSLYDASQVLIGFAKVTWDIGEWSKHADDALRDSQVRLAGIVDSALDAIITVDATQRILLFNRAAEKMFLCSSVQAIGQPLERFIPERFRTIHAEHIKAFGETGVTARSMGRARAVFGLRANGEEFAVEASISQTAAGGQKLYTVIMRDITERIRAEQRFHQVVEHAPNGLVMVDDAGAITLVNSQIENSFGYSREELLGQSIEMLMPPRFRGGHLASRSSSGAKRTVRPMSARQDLIGLRKDGIEFPVEIGLNPIESDHGPMVLATIVDITDRKRAEKKLRQSQEQLAGVIGSAMDAIITVDADQRIVLFNAAAEKMFQCTAAEAFGRTLERFMPDPKGGLSSMFGLRATGEAFPIEASMSQLETPEGESLRTVILRDITERRHAEGQLRRMHEELERRVVERTAQLQAVNKELEAFSYSVSHDLRAPLRGIDGFSQALLEDHADQLDDVGKGYLNEVRSASQEMAQLIEDVLQLARVTRSEMHHRLVNLSELAENILARLRRREPKRRVSVKIQPELVTSGDIRLLEIMLSNLLENAWKFTSKREEAEISFGKEQKDGIGTYFVRDNGAGFDMAYVDKLFRAFQRLHTEFEGTGIGLATVQRIVLRHGGSVSAVGVVNQGATISFTFPEPREG